MDKHKFTRASDLPPGDQAESHRQAESEYCEGEARKPSESRTPLEESTVLTPLLLAHQETKTKIISPPIGMQAFFNRLLQQGNTAFSTLDLPLHPRDVFDKLVKYYNSTYISINMEGLLQKEDTKKRYQKETLGRS